MKKSRLTIALSVVALILIGMPHGPALIRAEGKMKVILDTDIGDDIDDAWALAFLIAHKEFEPLGVTVAYGNTPARAKIACKLLYRTKQTHIPVAVGRKTKDHQSHQFTWAEDFEALKPISSPAAQFLVDMVKKYPKEVTVVAVGPQPNLGDAIKLGPEFENNVKEVILMSGCVYGHAGSPNEPIPEWNVVADVEAAQQVYGSKVKLSIVPLDSTTRVQLSDEERGRVREHRSPLTWSLECLYRLWLSGPGARMTLHDQLAIAEAAAPGQFFDRKVDLPIYVDEKGFTRIDDKKGRPITVCLEPKRDAFMEFYISHLTSQQLGMTP